MTPFILFIDLDRQNFVSKEDLDKWLQRILANISSILYGTKPLVLWSGNGYHIIIPVYAPEALEQFEDFRLYTNQPSNDFLRFAKDFLSCGKADTKNNPSFKSCLLRVPFTINSKSIRQEVKIIEAYDMNQQLNTIDRLLTAFQQRLGKTRSKTEVSVLSGVVVDAHKVVEFNGRSNTIALR